LDWIPKLVDFPFFGYVILFLPHAVLLGLAMMAIHYSVKGGIRRIVGFISCPILGTLCVGIGWWIAYIGFPENGDYYVSYPVAGWIEIVLGAGCILIGTLLSIFGNEKLTKNW